MRDAVADVIEERQALSRREWSGYPVSLAIHAALVFALIGIARAPDEPKQSVLNVRLAPSQPAARAAKATITSSAAPAAQIEAPKPPPPSEEPKKAPPALKNQESLFGAAAKPNVAKTPAATHDPPREEPVSAGATFAEPTPGIGLPGGGSAGITGLEGGDFPYTFYLERMVGLVGGNWLRPQTGADISVVVYFRIERSGAVGDARIIKSSGNGVFDRSALRAVLEASPLPPLPGGYRDRYLGVHLTFH